MSSINTMIKMGEMVTGPLTRIVTVLDKTVGGFERLERSSDVSLDGGNFMDARQELELVNSEIEEMRKKLEEAGNEQEKFNRKVGSGNGLMQGLKRTVAGLVGTYMGLRGVQAAMGLSDDMSQSKARLDLMNDGLQTTEELQNKIYASAQRARGEYLATMDAISKMGILAKDAFGSNDELIAFMEQVNKQFAIAGTSAEGQKAAMLQLTQAMGGGVLRGEELNSIFEQAPTIIQTIADYLDVPIGQIREMATEGELTADVVKSALISAADETNAKFESMPKTFAQLWTGFKNKALMAFKPVLAKMNEFANNEKVQQMLDGIANGLAIVAIWLLNILEFAGSVFSFFADNWSMISPIIYGIAAALGLYYGAMLLAKGATIAGAIAQGALTAAKMIAAPIYMLLTGATAAQTAAQLGLNGALYACPIVWIIMLIIALIALLFVIVAVINEVTDSNISAIGIICGALAVAGAFIGNLFVALINFAIDLFDSLWNFIAAFVNFFGNVFNDPVGAIARLFFDLVDVILNLLQSLASAIDAIFGSNLSGAVQGWRDSLSGWVDDTFGQGEEIMAKVDSSAMHMDRFEYSGAWDAGYNFGAQIDDKLSGLMDKDIFGDNSIPFNFEDEGLGQNAQNTANNTGAIKDSIDLTNEDLKYLRDLAETEIINRFTTAEVKVDFGGVHNVVNQNTDLDGMMDYVGEKVEDALVAVAEGVH